MKKEYGSTLYHMNVLSVNDRACARYHLVLCIE